MLKTGYEFGKVNPLAPQVNFEPEKVCFKNIFENANGGVSLLAFRKDQFLDTHLAPAEVMVYVIEGEVEFGFNDMPRRLKAGEFILMGEGVPHNVMARADSKLMLIKVKSTK